MSVEDFSRDDSGAWRETYIKPPEDGGMPEKFRLRMERFRRGCEVCGVMSWKMTKSGECGCNECGNIFDQPLMDEPDTTPEKP